MKLSSKSVLVLFVILLALSMTNCSKDPTEEERKELLLHKMLNDIVADSLENYVIWLQNMGTRFSLADDHRNIAVMIRNRFTTMGYDDVELDSFFITKTYRSINYEQWQYNVIATLEGDRYPDSLCVIGGHYDNILSSGDPFTIVPGANDNASGVSAVLEIARVIEKNKYQPESTIKFIAFGSEELGLFGSNDFAADPQGFSSGIRFMLNFDMIAYEPSSDPASWAVNIMDYDNSHLLRKEAESMCLKYTQLQYINDNKYNKQSDSYPFYTNGYKAIFFFSNSMDPNYHTLNDLAENCNFNYSGEIVKASCALLVNKN
ncbi:MAG: M28 family metallopeptidase [Bacteroidales bacterium]|jgi:leucyl aminopeptidase|nr:M28 family metallopeptidase [Bacteroidales bacterium]